MSPSSIKIIVSSNFSSKLSLAMALEFSLIVMSDKLSFTRGIKIQIKTKYGTDP